MKSLLSDPVVLICSAIIVIGIVSLFWAIGKFRRLKSSSPAAEMADDVLASTSDLRDIDFRTPAMPARVPASAVGKDVADRLESMTQRLAEMQAVLTKQSAEGAGQGQAGATGAVGQGFSPETIDKLLKIIGNVIQQVDILQKSVNPPNDGQAAKTDVAASPFTKI